MTADTPATIAPAPYQGPRFESCDLVVSRVLTDWGTEYCGRPESHDYELYLAIENIDHTRTKVKSPQTNGILRALPQDRAQGILPLGLPQEALFGHRCLATVADPGGLVCG
jgi:hypothetical protein